MLVTSLARDLGVCLRHWSCCCRLPSRYKAIKYYYCCLSLVGLLVLYGVLTHSTLWFTDEEQVKEYLRQYEKACEKATVHSSGDMGDCPCLPSENFTIQSEEEVEEWIKPLLEIGERTWLELESVHPGISHGGHWESRDCVLRQKAAIIVPYRKRESHLKIFLSYMHSFLPEQLLDYQIFVVEQIEPQVFSRASLFNIGILEANKTAPFDCYILHDVDMLPQYTQNMYSCFQSPLHLGAYRNVDNYQMPYPGYFGGAIAVSHEHIVKMNGFGNNYYGWGGEDDDAKNRILANGLEITRPVKPIGHMYALTHGRDALNPINPRRYSNLGLFRNTESYKTDGLNSIKYYREFRNERKLYTHIKVSITPQYKNECIVNTNIPVTDPGNYLNCLDDPEKYESGLQDCCKSTEGSLYCCDKYAWQRTAISLIGTVCSLVTAVILYRFCRQYLAKFQKSLPKHVEFQRKI